MGAPPQPIALEDLDYDIIIDDFEMVEESPPPLLDEADFIDVEAALLADELLNVPGLQQKQDIISRAVARIRDKLGLNQKLLAEVPSTDADAEKRQKIQHLADQMAQLKQKFAERSRQRAQLSDGELEAMFNAPPAQSVAQKLEEGQPPSLVEDDAVPIRTTAQEEGGFAISERDPGSEPESDE